MLIITFLVDICDIRSPDHTLYHNFGTKPYSSWCWWLSNCFILVTMGSPKWLGCIKAGRSWIYFLFCGMLGPIISFQPPQFDCEMALCYWDAIISMPLSWRQFVRKKIGNQAVVEMISARLGDSLFSSAACNGFRNTSKIGLAGYLDFCPMLILLCGH